MTSQNNETTNDAQNNGCEKFSVREVYYYKRIDKFFRNCDENIIATVIDIVNCNYYISLRILDWFVTKYSKRRKILIDVDGKDEDSTYIDVHISYKAQLKSYKKKYFDPFKRREKFNYHFKNVNKTILTAICQLNFFKWIIENNILDYVKKNFDVLSKEMNLSNKNDKKKKKDKVINKLSKSNNKLIDPTKNNIIDKNNININVKKKLEHENIKIILTFD